MEKGEEQDPSWTTPTKGIRSPTKQGLCMGECSNLSNSFSCLSDKDENGEDLYTKGEESSNVIDYVVEDSEVKKDVRLPASDSNTEKQNLHVAERQLLWTDLRHHQDSPMFKDKAWLICGDFNEILDSDDHSLNASFPFCTSGMREFQDLARYCELSDMSYHGQRFTWCNKRKDGVICKKLDRVLINKHWFQHFAQSYSVFEPGGCSDHLRCSSSGLSQRLGTEMAYLTITVSFYLCNAKTMMNPTSTAVSEEADAYDKWRKLSDLEESYLKQKAKLHWLKIGDQNNKVFHTAVTLREASNSIKEIHCDNGQVVTTQDQIKTEAERYFQTFLTLQPTDYVPWSQEELETVLDFKCGESDRSLLTHDVSKEEIRRTGFLPKGVNSTILALIPKKKKARLTKDYRPISCCNVLYKVISKILENHLKIILPKFIAPNQSAFVKDRLLMENVLLATEIIKDYHKDSVSPRCALKIDISKAFDSVQWSFLLTVLRAMAFPEQYVGWIQTCITTASFSVQVNGELAGYFGSKRGLRQGCSLSPYLFVICMNVLSCKLDIAASRREFGYHPKCKQLKLTHLCFADDLMVFVEGTKQSISGALQVFDDFAVHSGLHISLEKSTIYTAGVSSAHKEEILQQFPFEYGSLPVRYLGLPLLPRRMTSGDYLPLIEKIRSRITSWTSRMLSFAGRLQLISSVIFSLTNFWISAFRLPKSCVKEIDQLCSAFLWSGPSLNAKKAKVAWTEVCLPKSEGGLGLRSIAEANKVSVLKLIWRILSASDSLWVDWVQRSLIRRGSFWSMKDNTTSGSWIWRNLLKYRGLAKQFYKVEVHNGESTSFWFDNWCQLGSLYDQLGDRGSIDLGILKTSTMAEVLSTTRRKTHRNPLLNAVEEEIKQRRLRYNHDVLDVPLWKGKNDCYRNAFSTKDTWSHIHAARLVATGERIQSWNPHANTSCILCDHPSETREHLFFQCTYSQLVWEQLLKKLLVNQFTNHWQEVLTLTAGNGLDKTTKFIVRYVLQNTIHAIWRERNARRHGEQSSTAEQLIKIIDKNIRNRLSTMKGGEESIQVWFAAKFY
ncbi:PREDICTED: uncharacterized protein LOC104728123 [Camelina sativa]|uniref:Uncharacterized protein LOC104728123 n=1 Tax=Camelina sativa TaxID=90675 RepID=A0ABM0USB8_CAMSA|nr:PREDICTED: uncharacterized protein LOC104728123 [Camelina sativa]